MKIISIKLNLIKIGCMMMNKIRVFSKKSLDVLINEINFLNNHTLLYEDFMCEYEESYRFIKKEYRNEYFFKNMLFNKMVLGRYSLRTTSCLNEVIINNSKADIIMINKNVPNVFEIKTELDNFEKLAHQLNDYYKVATKVYVVTSESMYYPLYRILKDTPVGIYILTRKDTFSLKKGAKEDSSNLDYGALFKLLRKKEYEKIILDKFGLTPEVKDYEYFTACFNLFKQLDINEAMTAAYNELKNRDVIYMRDSLKSFPIGLRWLIYTSKINETNYLNLLKFFNNE